MVRRVLGLIDRIGFTKKQFPKNNFQKTISTVNCFSVIKHFQTEKVFSLVFMMMGITKGRDPQNLQERISCNTLLNVTLIN